MFLAFLAKVVTLVQAAKEVFHDNSFLNYPCFLQFSSEIIYLSRQCFPYQRSLGFSAIKNGYIFSCAIKSHKHPHR